jgi:hypothetical protein
MPEQSPKRFKDFAKEPALLDGEKIRIDKLLGKEIMVIGYRIAPSKFDDGDVKKGALCLTIQFEYPSKKGHYIVFTGSEILLRQFQEYAQEIPFLATIKRVDRFFSLS